MAFCTVIVPRTGFEEQMRTQVAQNVEFRVGSADNEEEAVELAEDLFERESIPMGHHFFKESAEAYPVLIWETEDSVPVTVGWEIDGEGTTTPYWENYFPEDD